MTKSFAAALTVFISSFTLAQNAPVKPADPPASQPAEAEEDFVYLPPAATAGRATLGGGSRSTQVLPAISALAPDHVALSASESPTLYWFCAADTDLPSEFSIVDFASKDTVKRIRTDGPTKAGWHKIDLAQLGVKLAADSMYEWRVALVANTANPSDNAVVGAMVKHVAAEVSQDESPVLRAAQMARAGFWHDAISTLMATDSADSKAALKKILRQVKLNDAADYAER